jgi:uncharacterized protein
MSIYTISDLHLALSIDKPMDVFGARWINYMEKLKTEWGKTVTNDDIVIIPGDISWATYLLQAYEDLNFIELLPGKKIISKGNHDYWWTTLNKLDKFLLENNFSTISFMHNNSFIYDNKILCGTRGWKCPGDDDFSMEDDKIFKRECRRLEISLKSAEKILADSLIVALHYPPFNSRKEPSKLVELMAAFGVKTCIYGHLHGEGFKNAIEGPINGIEFRLVSADYLNFKPLKLF